MDRKSLEECQQIQLETKLSPRSDMYNFHTSDSFPDFGDKYSAKPSQNTTISPVLNNIFNDGLVRLSKLKQ